MSQIFCSDCGYGYDSSMPYCPNCGCPTPATPPAYQTPTLQPQVVVEENVYSGPTSNNTTNNTTYVEAPERKRTDWANYISECAEIFYKTVCQKFATFSGRASRREFWSFVFMYYVVSPWCCLGVILLIPFLAVTIRRLHDMGRSGWWCLLPIVPFFFYLRKSDEGPNQYGYPDPAKNYLRK